MIEYCSCDQSTPQSHNWECWECDKRVKNQRKDGISKPVESRPISFHDAWERFVESYDAYHRVYDVGAWHYAIRRAQDDGILSTDGGYEILGCNMNLVPRDLAIRPMFFVQLGAVYGWISLDMKNVQYPYQIRKVEVVK